MALAKRVMDASARPALAATLELEVVSQERCAARAAQAVLGRPLGSHLLTAGPVEWVSGR